jgi:hypothetical protein
MRRLLTLLAAVVLAVLAYIAVGAAMFAVSGPLPMRGTMVDIGGRKLHLVCEGPKAAKPTLLFEAGSFGFFRRLGGGAGAGDGAGASHLFL